MLLKSGSDKNGANIALRIKLPKELMAFERCVNMGCDKSVLTLWFIPVAEAKANDQGRISASPKLKSLQSNQAMDNLYLILAQQLPHSGFGLMATIVFREKMLFR